ncbi:hypothetical protein [Chishuiella sp.]|uniref:hypothetical protein n=1 Tax=Chishuiella sp. TaxID=1969467 RepID=UPI0028B03995|nr:hypothetical protein [Chishuiella sp.]
MKNIILLSLLFLISCNGQEKEKNKTYAYKSDQSENNYNIIDNKAKVIPSSDQLIIIKFSELNFLSLISFPNPERSFLEIKNQYLNVDLGQITEYGDKPTIIKTKEILIFEKNGDYIILIPTISEEFPLFQMYGISTTHEFKNYGNYTYSYEDVKKLGITFDKVQYMVRNLNNTPRIYALVGNKSILLSNYEESYLTEPITDLEKYVIKQNKVPLANDFSLLEKVMQDNITTPEMVIDYLVFTKDNKGNLEINTEILDYISKTTTKENSSYLFALENYGQKSRSSLGWSIDEFAEIRGYIFNTSYPLRRKYWSDKYEEWYNGEPKYIFGDSDSWRDNDYYGLPHLKEYVKDFIVTYW